ncbi:uncharacterized protein LOC133723294 [Rosa rugosa]|uniref:uncharacterized protein LOC133723294 n=1 Tax=Rosa rugosa TaxID=74645 RepID=UPI002B415316|nr:uncharacterized protein LOC133723294 [Rosa rugosa]
MDCTYKTNRYRFPLFEIVGVTSTEKTFNVAFVYILRETEENYTWALSRLRILPDHCTPSVFVTDRELALMNSISKIFPDSQHLLCKWHINRNMMKECKKKIATAEMWNMFLNAWNTAVGSTTESEYWANLKEFESKFSTYPDELRYLKRELHIKASFEKNRCFLQHDFKHEYLKELISYVSITSLNKIVCEANRADSIKKDVACCGCVIRVTHGLPCMHEIAEYKRSNRPIPIDAVHNHWRQLGINQAMHNDTEEKVPVKQHMLRLETWIKQQNDEYRRHLLIKIDELMNPGSTFLKQPVERAKTKGRPHKTDTSTRRLPSGFEIENTLSGPDSHSQAPTVYEVGQDVSHGPIISIQDTASSKKLRIVQLKIRVVASAMGFGRKSWRKVHRDLLNELHSMRELYVILFGGIEVEKVQQTVNHYGSGNAPEKYWMYFPEMEHLIARCYGVVVIFLSEGKCRTFLPLVEHKIGQFSNDELKEIGIGHVNKNHFVHTLTF